MLKTGQIGSLVLLGVVGFLHFEKRGKDVVAGGFLALTALKPHLVYLMLVAVFVWVIIGLRWRIVCGGFVVIAITTLFPLLANPHVLQQYRAALAEHPPLDWATPTLGTLLRLWCGPERYWLQFVFMPLGLLWLLGRWYGSRGQWNWVTRTPSLLLVSFLTTFYGTWSHDQVVSLLALLQVATCCVETPRRLNSFVLLAFYVLLDALIVALDLTGFNNELWLFWLSPTLLGFYLFSRRFLGIASN